MLSVSEPASAYLTPSLPSGEQQDMIPQGTTHIKFNSPSSPPVLRLPTELLCYIFRMLFDIHRLQVSAWHDDLPLIRRRAKRPSQPPWTVILQVCRDWRSAALGYAMLWKHIYVPSSGWTSHFLQSSAQLPLDLNLETLGSTTNVQVARLLGKHAGRIRSLSLFAPATVGAGHINDLMNHFLGQGAPRLTCLELTALEPHVEDGSSDRLLLALGDILFSGRISNLDTLRIDCPSGYLFVQMDCPAFRMLTCLEITSDHAWQWSTMMQFLTCLQTWTRLRQLNLEFGLPEDMTGILPVMFPARIALPSIENLRLKDQAPRISNFLALVSLQPSILLTLDFVIAFADSSLDDDSLRRATVLNIVSQVSELIAAPLVYLEFLFFNCDFEADSFDGRIALYADTVTYDVGSDEPSSFPRIKLLSTITGVSQVYTAYFHMMLLDAPELSHVTKLALYPTTEYLQIDWFRAFQNLQQLRDLLIFADEFDPLIEVLGTAASELHNEQTGEIERELYAPNLQYLELSPRWMNDFTIDALVQSLKNRMEWGSPLPLLCIRVPDEPLVGPDARVFAEVVSSFVSEAADL